MKHSLIFRTAVVFLLISPLLISTPVPTSAYTDCDGIEEDDVALVSYTGTIAGGDRNGEIFDSNDQVRFTISASSLIVGFYEGMLGMKVGERKTITVPPSKGYTQSSHDLYGQTLVFEVFVDQIISELRECDDAAGEGSSFVSGLLTAIGWILGIGVTGFAVFAGYSLTQRVTTPECAHCISEGRERASEGKCGKCGNYYCRASFSRGCPTCGSNSFVPNK